MPKLAPRWSLFETANHPRRTIKLSYSYINYPVETTPNVLMGYYGGISSYISSVYSKANVGINWTDNGVLTYEWDLNGDGNSASADRVEEWSPMTANVIPNQNQFFSNVFMLRLNKDDAFKALQRRRHLNGPWTTSLPPRGALVRAALMVPPNSTAPPWPMKLVTISGCTTSAWIATRSTT